MQFASPVHLCKVDEGDQSPENGEKKKKKKKAGHWTWLGHFALVRSVYTGLQQADMSKSPLSLLEINHGGHWPQSLAEANQM